jgi:hypothetical protein
VSGNLESTVVEDHQAEEVVADGFEQEELAQILE